jgi:DNA-directed RNA polymerase subunit RPC12/RpoP
MKKKIEAFVCTMCGRDIPAVPEVFEEEITEEEIQEIEELWCSDCCGWFMIPVEGPTFGGGIIVATGERIPPHFPNMKDIPEGDKK